MTIGKYILDLLGRKFLVGDWEFYSIPLLGIPANYWPCKTRDRYTDIPVTLFFPEDRSHYIMQIYNNELKIYVRYQVKFIEYIPKQDMRNIRV